MPAPITPPAPYEHDHENEVVLFGQTNFRNQQRKFGIKTDDRRRHMYVLGKTGMGKTTLMENMVLADVYAGHGLAYIDPHGDTAEKFLDFIPAHRINDVVYVNPSDMEYPVGFNILETFGEGQKHLVAAGLMGVFKKIWPDVWSSRMEYILLNTIMALLDFPGSTLLGINRLLSDADYRKRVVSLIQDPVVKTFWLKEFASFSEKYRTEAVAPLQNKVGQFLSATIIRNIVAQVKSTINMREIMDQRKILIVNLAKGRIGEENSRLLGAMMITRLQLSAMERVDMPEKDRQDFYLYVDEFQNFATESFANILSEARKYRLALIVAHQYIEQLDETVRWAVFGNVGTIVTFRVGAADATYMEQEFMPRFTPEDLVNLKKYEVYLKLMIDGAASEPFSATTLPPIAERTNSTEKVIRVSRERYSTTRKEIESHVIKWSGFGTADVGATIKTDDEDEQELAAKIAELEKTSPNVGEMAMPAGEFASKKKKPKFEVPCSVCGKISELTFEPDWSKPWLCKEHLELKQQGLLPKMVLKSAGAMMPGGRPPGAAAVTEVAVTPPAVSNGAGPVTARPPVIVPTPAGGVRAVGGAPSAVSQARPDVARSPSVPQASAPRPVVPNAPIATPAPKDSNSPTWPDLTSTTQESPRPTAQPIQSQQPNLTQTPRPVPRPNSPRPAASASPTQPVRPRALPPAGAKGALPIGTHKPRIVISNGADDRESLMPTTTTPTPTPTPTTAEPKKLETKKPYEPEPLAKSVPVKPDVPGSESKPDDSWKPGQVISF